ncbi:stage II sporulation protein R [Sporosarcina oncorhynchi]|uniref:Stage II sporulation protein R n=1 Tax=Sporosarcina oncorhynchi TaxID=3056444 RepID=A0ABZ0L738_9BACL|nr:stage II sporulation protein R [Sporosarcina sp. T2O-4]WOV87989.1 stage II sporulation protein R [Sporosarcina sp. T2O-4]
MIQDYEITIRDRKVSERMRKGMAIVEFVLVLFIIQSALLLLMDRPIEQEAEIRFRVLAHSNTTADQKLKEAIQREIAPLINSAVNQAESKSDIVNNLKNVESTILSIAQTMAGDQEVQFERKAALFPAKRSGFVITPQAPYDAYILTIGSGRGDNWWCGLFPRVCFPDKTVDKIEETPVEDEKVTFFVWEWIKSWFA